MDWSEQAESMMKSWTEAQKALWESWANMVWGSPAAMPSPGDLVEGWQMAAERSLETWKDITDPIARSTAEQFLASQGVVLRFMEFAAHAWQNAMPRIESGEDWSSALSESMDRLRESWLQLPANLAAISQDVNELWKLYMAQWGSFGTPWEMVFSSAPGYLGKAATGDRQAFFELSDMYRDAYQGTFGRIASSPNLGMTRELNRKLAEGFDAFVAWNLANLEYQTAVGEIWDQAFKGFSQDIATLAEKGEIIESLRDLILLWTRGAERIFTEAFRTERYTLAQGKLLNASMNYRIHQRTILEEFLKLYDLPTRTELDEAHRRIYELRKEVKALKKALAGPSADKPARARPQPTRKKSQPTRKIAQKAAGLGEKGG